MRLISELTELRAGKSDTTEEARIGPRQVHALPLGIAGRK